MTEDIEKYEARNQTRRDVIVPENSFLTTIKELASRPDIDPEKIKQFMDMQERILDRNAKQAFNAAMTRVQNKIELVVAAVENEQTHSRYANLKAILLKAKPVYTGEGFSLMFYEGDTTKEAHKRICVDIMHEEGHTEKRWGDFAVQTTGIAGKAMMTQIHGEGSAFSYGRRYLTCAIFNIPTGDDDDGNAAGSEFITPEQAKEVNRLLKESGANVGNFFKRAGAETVDTIAVTMHDRCVAYLKTVIAMKAKQAKDRQPGDEG